jgi:acetylglutamate kinase
MKGVMKNIKEPNSLIERIDMKIYKSLLNNNIVSDGMIPKIDNAFYGLKNGIKNIFIGSPEMISGETKFTKIVL